MDETPFRGVFSLLLTPFLADRSIDWPGYERYLGWQLEAEPHGLFAVCGSSEMNTLELEERLELARRAVRMAGTTPVVATANLGPDRGGHRDEIRRMADTGVAGVVLVPPPGLGEDQESLGAYFAGLVDEAPCPVLIYEWPGSSPHLVEARIYEDLVRNHSLAGIKDTTCTIEGIGAKIERTGRATVFQANAPFFLDALRRGARGIMAIVSTAGARVVVRLWKAFFEASEELLPLHEHLVLLDCALGRGGAYPASAKHLARMQGVRIGTTCRAPAVLSSETEKAVEVWLAHAERSGIAGLLGARASRGSGLPAGRE